jgi:hypothetical protein
LVRREAFDDAVHHRGRAGAVAELLKQGDEVIGGLAGDRRYFGLG